MLAPFQQFPERWGVGLVGLVELMHHFFAMFAGYSMYGAFLSIIHLGHFRGVNVSKHMPYMEYLGLPEGNA